MLKNGVPPRVEMKAVTDLYPSQTIRMLNTTKLDTLQVNFVHHGLKEPVLVYHYNNRWYIINGHHRVVSLYRMGLQTIPCIALSKEFTLGYTLDDVKYVTNSMIYDWEELLGFRFSQAG